MNKTLTTLLFLCGLISNVFAQVPQGFSYQAVARDAAGNCIVDEMITIQMSILDGSSSGTIIYQEQFGGVTTNASGLFSIVIGEGAPQSPFTVADFEAIDWSTGSDRFLEVQMAIDNNPNNLVQVGKSQLMSVPFALGAEKAIEAATAQHAVFADSSHATVYSDSAIYALNGLQLGTPGDEVLRWHGPNGQPNGFLAGTGSTVNNGSIELFDDTGDRLVSLRAAENSSNGEDVGTLVLYGENGNQNVNASWSGDYNHGSFSLRDPNGNVRAAILSEDDFSGAGRVSTYGNNGSRNMEFSVQTSTTTTGQNRGGLRSYDENNAQQAYFGIGGAGNGSAQFNGPNSNLNIVLGTAGGNANHGGIDVRDANGNGQASMFVDANGDGYLAADFKPFFMDHPEDPGKEIWYCAVEGPEAGAYDRGTAQLVNGIAHVEFSDHFSIVANEHSMTIMLTPWSADSEGLAVIVRSATGFTVKELRKGSGSYQFDWEVKAKRAGHEDWQVIRNKKELVHTGLEQNE
ncbi:MAG: hypothetical protein AAF587_17740 [Bacteroidota bacterium]